MLVQEKAKQHPNRRATMEFVEAALNELSIDIDYIEKRHHVILMGERAKFDSARRDLEGLTYRDVCSAISSWKENIRKRMTEYIDGKKKQ